MEQKVAASYIRENFEPSDRIAVVLLNKQTGVVLQRIARAERVASPAYQSWLHLMNAQKYDVYISMNSLKEGAQRRTKEDVELIRHIFLDFDENGTRAVEALVQREDLPEPNYLLNSSPDKWQVVWKIQHCSREQAEEIERGLVMDSGADAAVIDVARVLRLPGFYNHKYSHPHLISLERRSEKVCIPENFPRAELEARQRTRSVRPRIPRGHRSQSERDWAAVRDALRKGSDPEVLIAELSARRSDKFNPIDYARRTVEKAVRSLRDGDADPDPWHSDEASFER
jgi:hypothetical protein